MVDEQATRRVRAVLETLVEAGEEVGLQAAAYLDGELVVDAWAGLTDQDTGRPVDRRDPLHGVLDDQGNHGNLHPHAGRPRPLGV